MRGDCMEDETFEFSVSNNRSYTLDHLWLQEREDAWAVGVTDFLAKDLGEVLRVILPHVDDEINAGEDLVALWTADEKIALPAPFSGVVVESNGELESNPEIINESAYESGWLILFRPYDGLLDDVEVDLLQPEEYIEALQEI